MIDLDSMIEASGLSVGDVAVRAELDPRGLFKLRTGLVRKPRTGTLERLAKALGTTPDAVRTAILFAANRRHVAKGRAKS